MTAITTTPLATVPSVETLLPTDSLITIAGVQGSPAVTQITLSGLMNSMTFQNPTGAASNTGIPSTVGGIAAGTVLHGVPVHTVLQKLLFPIPAPRFTSFTTAMATTYMCGEVSATSGSFSWAIAYPSLVTDSATVVNGADSSTIHTYTAGSIGTATLTLGTVGLSRTTPGSIAVTNRLPFGDTTVTSAINFSWAWPVLSNADTGTAVPDSTQLIAMNRTFGASRNHTVTIPANATRITVAFPSDTSAPTAIIHTGTGFNIKDSFTISTVQVTSNSAYKTYTVYTYLPTVAMQASTLLVQF